jgi:hypothetical protein
MIVAPRRVARNHSLQTRIASLLLLTLAWFSPWATPKSAAQSATTGAVAGTVTDQTGATVPDVSIKIIAEATGDVRTINSQGSGTYLAPLLLPGVYRLEASKAGFKTLVLTGIHVFVTETETLNFRLELGPMTQTITVIAEGTVLETENPTLGHVTDGEMVRDLPLVNRNYTQIVGLSPGVVTDVNDASDLGPGGSSYNAANQGFSAHGGATNDNNFQMNGSEVNDLMGSAIFSGGVPIPNPDAIQEFKVQTGQYDASYGRNAGANVDVVTKGGSNEFHGSIFEFLRNDVLNANDYFLNAEGAPRASLKQNQFGFALGGPAIKDKLLFFGSYQGTRQVNGLDTSAACLSTFITPPELAAAGGRSATELGAAFAGEMSPVTGQTIAADGSNIVPQAVSLLQLTLPNGNFLIPAPQNTTTGESTLTENCFYNADQFVTNVDFLPTSKSKLSLKFFYNDGSQAATFPAAFSPTLPGFPQDVHTGFRDFSLNYTYTFSSNLFNQFGVGFNRLSNLLSQGEPQVSSAGGSGASPFTYSLIGVTAPGEDNNFPGIGVDGSWELGGNGQGLRLIQNAYNIDDLLSYVRGRHSFRFGGGFSAQQINFERFHFLGAAIFLDFPDLLLGTVFESEDLVGLPDRAWRALNADAFAQDDIKLTSRLTVNLGVRYERQGAIGDDLGRAAIFDISKADPTSLTGSLAGYVVASNFHGTIPAGVSQAGNNAAINEDGQNNVAPRVGFAWQLPYTNRLVLRGGYGMYFTRSTGQPFLQLLGAPPFGLIRQELIQPFSSPFPAAPASIPFFPAYALGTPTTPPTSLTPVTFSPNFRPPIVQEYSMSLQAELARNLVFEVGYEGSRGSKLIQFRDFNQALDATPSNPVNGNTSNTLANLATRVPIEGLSPTNSDIIESAGSSWYNALNVSLNKRFSHGLEVLASYTWARELTADNAYSTSPNGGVLVGNQNDPASRYGADGFVRPQRLVISYVYDFPGPHDRLSPSGRVLGGWSVAGVTTFQSGHYLTISDVNLTNAFGIAGAGMDTPDLATGCTRSQLATHGSVESRLNGFFNAACVTGPPVITADGGTDFGNLGVSVVRGPGQANFDIALVKKTPLLARTERMNLEFRAEFFNAFNHPQFADPSATNLIAGEVVGPTFVPLPSFGVITNTSVNPRVIQLALKLNF